MRLPLTRALARIESEHKDVTVFRGLNKLPRLVPGEMASMANCGSRFPGCLYPRASRELIETLTTPNAMFIADSGVRCTVDGTSFKYGGVTKGTVTSGLKSMCDFYGTVIIMPDKKYYNYKTDTFGTLGTGATYPADGGVPDMDRIYSHSNRVWGFKGVSIYASKHMDCTVWNQFSVDEDGVSTPMDDDSVMYELPAHYGSIKGMAPAENHMCFATEHSTYEIYGDTPLNYTPRLISENKGTVDGRSMVPLDGRIYSAVSDGVTAYAGSHPRQIGYPLDIRPVEAVGGTDGRRYYVSIKVGSTWTLYALDTALLGGDSSAWFQEDNLQVIDFAMFGGFLYALASDGKVWKFNSGTEVIDWTAETEEFNYGYLGNTTVPQIKFEGELEPGSTLQVQLRVGTGSYSTIGNFAYAAPQETRYYSTYIFPQRASRFQVKFIGHGNVMVKSLVRDIIPGSDVQV